MQNYVKVHPVTPQQRFVKQAVEQLNTGGIIVYPTDSAYGFACSISNLQGIEKIAKIKKDKESHLFSIICSDISMVSNYVVIEDWAHRIIKRCWPGPFTFIFHARKEVPKKILPNRKTVGLRIPQNQVCQMIIDELKAPLLSTTAVLSSEIEISDPEEHKSFLMGHFDYILDCGVIPSQPSTIVDLTQGEPLIIREGVGDPSLLG